MSMKIEDIKKYGDYEKDEIKIHKFLEAGAGEAFNYMEIFNNLKPKSSFPLNRTWKKWVNFGIRVIELHIFHDTLKRMVNNGKIRMKVYQGIEYYYIE